MKHWTERRLREITSDRLDYKLNMPEEYPPIEARRTEDGGVRDRFFAAKAELPDEITVLRPYSVDGFKNETVIYVAPDGRDTSEGTKESPVATLHEALRRAEGCGGAKIVLRGGEYNFKQTAKITCAHSGTEESPLIITAEDGEVPCISASYDIPATAFVPVTDEAVLARLNPEVRDRVLVCDLPSLGITDYGTLGYGGAVLLCNNIPQVIARYPNEGEVLIPMSENIIEPGGHVYNTHGPSLGREGPWEIGITDERCLTWQWHEDIWLYGALYAEWGRRFAPIGGFDSEKMSMRGRYAFEWGLKYEPDNNYYFFNILEELDVPGEWYLDRECGKLYFYPPSGELTGEDSIRFASGACGLVEVDGAEHVLLDRLDLGRCVGSAFYVHDSLRVLIQRCHVTGTCEAGDEDVAAVEITDGKLCGIIASTVEHFTNRAVSVSGGDRLNLIPSNNFAQNCFIINPHTRFGISASGCGNLLSHNYVHNTTMGDGGHNEGIHEYNVVEGGDTETSDTGMIYVAGGGCSSCGTHFRYNYFFDFAKGDYGIYFDDLSRGMYAYGNIVVGNGFNEDGSWTSGGRSYNAHNGGEHCFYNNISIDAGYFAFGGDITYWLFDNHWDALFPGILEASLDKRTEKYLGRNPTYRDYCEALDEYNRAKSEPGYVVKSSPAERRLRSPWCINYENNVIVRAARPFKIDHGEETATCLETNFITDDDPGFVDFENRDYRFREDAPVYERIPDFVPPPFEKMGPVDDYE